MLQCYNNGLFPFAARMLDCTKRSTQSRNQTKVDVNNAKKQLLTQINTRVA